MSLDDKPALVLDPKSELHFKGPFTEVVTSHLKLSNPTDRRICFKVKTTAPKRYCVRPNNGIVEPQQAALIAVMLQPFDIESQTDRNKHKFMVQTMFVPDGDVNQDALWREATPDAIHDSKLKCVFDTVPRPAVSGDVAAGGGSNNVSSTELPAAVQRSLPTPLQPTQSNNLTSSSTWNNTSGTPLGASNVSSSSAASAFSQFNISSSAAASGLNGDNANIKNQAAATVPVVKITNDSASFGAAVAFGKMGNTPLSSQVPDNRGFNPIIPKVERSPVKPAGIGGGASSDQEVRSLREEINRLRTENMHLKEEGLRQRIRSGESGASSRSSTAELLKSRGGGGGSFSSGQVAAGQDVVQLLMNPNVLAIGLVLFVIGIVLGKVVF